MAILTKQTLLQNVIKDVEDSAQMVPLVAVNMVPLIALNMVPGVALNMVPGLDALQER